MGHTTWLCSVFSDLKKVVFIYHYYLWYYDSAGCYKIIEEKIILEHYSIAHKANHTLADYH